MTAQELYALPADANGWRTLPLGNDVTLGNGVKLGDCVRLGNGVKLGDCVKLGNDVKLDRSPLQIQGPQWIVYPHSPGKIGIGCHVHTLAEWEESWEDIAEEEKCSPEDAELYRRYAMLVWEWMKTNMPEPVKETTP